MSVNPIDLYVGTKLKIRRVELGLSQSKLGELAGITFQQVQKYEKGMNRIGSSRLYSLSKILKVPVDYFFEDYEIAEASNIFKDIENSNVLSKEVISLIRYYTSIEDPKARKGIANLVKSLSNIKDDEEVK